MFRRGKTVPVTWSDDKLIPLSYYIAPVGDRTHDLPHTVAPNMVMVSHALTHSATVAVPHGALPLCRNDIEPVEKHHVCKKKIRILIENTPRITAMLEGTGTFAVWAHNQFQAYDRPEYYCNWRSPNSHITPW